MRLLSRAHGNLPSANHGYGARDSTSQLVGYKPAGVSRTRGVRSLTGRVARADVASFAVLRSDIGSGKKKQFRKYEPAVADKTKNPKKVHSRWPDASVRRASPPTTTFVERRSRSVDSFWRAFVPCLYHADSCCSAPFRQHVGHFRRHGAGNKERGSDLMTGAQTSQSAAYNRSRVAPLLARGLVRTVLA